MLVQKQLVSLENIVGRCQNRAKIAAGKCDFGGLRELHLSSSLTETLGYCSSVVAIHQRQARVLLRRHGGGENIEGMTMHKREEGRKEKERKEEKGRGRGRGRGDTWGRVGEERVSWVAGLDWPGGQF